MDWKRLKIPALILALGFPSCDHASGIREPTQKHDATVDAGGPFGNGGAGPVGTAGTVVLGRAESKARREAPVSRSVRIPRWDFPELEGRARIGFHPCVGSAAAHRCCTMERFPPWMHC